MAELLAEFGQQHGFGFVRRCKRHMPGFAADRPPAAGLWEQGGSAETGSGAEHDLRCAGVRRESLADWRKVAVPETGQGQCLGLEVVEEADPFDGKRFADGCGIDDPVAVGHGRAAVGHRPGHRHGCETDLGFAEIVPRRILEGPVVVGRKHGNSLGRPAVAAQGETDIRAAEVAEERQGHANGASESRETKVSLQRPTSLRRSASIFASQRSTRSSRGMSRAD